MYGYRSISAGVQLYPGAVTQTDELSFLTEFVNCTDKFLIRLLLKDHSKYFGKITVSQFPWYCMLPLSFSSPCNAGLWRDVNAMLKKELEN